MRIGVIDLVIKRNNPAARFKEQGRKVKEERHRFDRDKFFKNILAAYLLSPLKIKSIEFIALSNFYESKLSKTLCILFSSFIFTNFLLNHEGFDFLLAFSLLTMNQRYYTSRKKKKKKIRDKSKEAARKQIRPFEDRY